MVMNPSMTPKRTRCKTGSLLLLAAALHAPVAVGKVVIQDVLLKSGFVNRTAISAEIVGEITDECLQLDDIRFVVSPHAGDKNEINVFLEIGSRYDRDFQIVCAQTVAPFIREVDVGILEPGFYTLNVFEHMLAAPVFSKGISVPFDVHSVPHGIDYNRYGRRQMPNRPIVAGDADVGRDGNDHDG